MTTHHNLFESSSHSLFRRCVQCQPEPPQCPNCASDETCSLQAQSCDACAMTTCVKIGSLPGQLAEKSSTPIGAIVGGVIGAVVIFAAILYLSWRFKLKKRKQVEVWDPPEKRDQSTLSRGDRQSTRSQHSIASTVLTRASNVIQIAYIPGVTVRSPPESPGLLIPPVPSIPGSSTASSAQTTPHLDQHFFMPSDLRDSTWSDTSSIGPRISIAPSLVRASVATTIYGSDVIVPPIPAQHAFRAHANMVSVKTANNIPAMPQISGPKAVSVKPVMARPVEVKKASSVPRVPTLGNLAKDAAVKAEAASVKSVPVFSDEKEVVVQRGNPFADPTQSPIAKPQPALSTLDTATSSSTSPMMPADGPLGIPPAPTHRHSNNAGINAMIEDAINRAVRVPKHTGLGGRPTLKAKDSGPFSDVNEVKENIL